MTECDLCDNPSGVVTLTLRGDVKVCGGCINEMLESRRSGTAKQSTRTDRESDRTGHSKQIDLFSGDASEASSGKKRH